MRKLRIISFAALAALAMAGGALAGRADVKHEDLFVPKGQEQSGDLVSDKSIAVEGKLNGDAVSLGGGSVKVAGEVTGDVVSMGGPVYVTGVVRHDISNIGGTVEIAGRVYGDVSAVGGKVALVGKGEVDGEISAIGGSIEKSTSSVHRGGVNSISEDAIRGVLANSLKTVRNAYRWHGDRHGWNRDGDGIGAGTIGLIAAAALAGFFVMLAGAMLVVLLPAVFFPDNVRTVSAAITGDIWKTCGIGALALVCFFPGLLLMVVSILGIPLIPFALILCFIAAVLGLAAFALPVQARFFTGINKQGPAGLVGQVAVGAGLCVGLLFFGKLVPIVGGVLSLVGVMLLAFGLMTGLGAAWLTRLGTRPYAAVPAAAPAVLPVVQAQPPAGAPGAGN